MALLVCCLLPNTTHEKSQHNLQSQDVLHLRREPLFPERYCAQKKAEREREGRVFTRVSRGCWPCLRVSFISKVTHKKSQHMSAQSVFSMYLLGVQPPLPTL